MGSGRLLMPPSVGEEMIYMAELREAHLRYLLAIYELGRNDPNVGTQAVAKALNCSKASVTKMAGILMDMGLLVRERYGKIYLTDTGFLLAKDMLRCVEVIHGRLPAMGFDLTEEETRDFVRTMAVICRSIVEIAWPEERDSQNRRGPCAAVRLEGTRET